MTDSSTPDAMRIAFDIDQLDFTKGHGLVTVVTQDAESGVVLMVAHADRDALEQSCRTGEMHYRSRSRGLWHKGATSGHTQAIVSLTADCDRDAVLARVHSRGPACHDGTTSCFRDTALQADVVASLDATITARMHAGDAASAASSTPPSYTQRLLADRNLRLKKLGEEAVELATACVDADRERAVEEAADLLYHALVAVRAVGGSWQDIQAVLAMRAG